VKILETFTGMWLVYVFLEHSGCIPLPVFLKSAILESCREAAFMLLLRRLDLVVVCD